TNRTLSFFLICIFFFFQAEDGIRVRNVTGVQTCALPISLRRGTDPPGIVPGEGLVEGLADRGELHADLRTPRQSLAAQPLQQHEVGLYRLFCLVAVPRVLAEVIQRGVQTVGRESTYGTDRLVDGLARHETRDDRARPRGGGHHAADRVACRSSQNE